MIAPPRSVVGRLIGLTAWFYHSDVTVISENREDSLVDFEMIARDPEWQHIAVAVTNDASNEHLIRFICDGKVVSEMNREGTLSNIAELLSSSVSFHVGPPNVQSFPTLFQGFRAEPWFNVFGKDFEPSLLLADTCVAVCPEGVMKLADFSAPALQVSSRVQPLFRSHSCLRLFFEFGGVLCPARGYLGLQVRRFCAHSPWCLQGLLGKGV